MSDVSVVRSGTTIFHNRDKPLSIHTGDKIGIIGANGAGKTTFIKVILNLIKYDGHVQRHINSSDIGVQMQQNEFSDLMKVKEIISLVCNCSIKDERLQHYLRTFRLETLLHKRLSYLSGGEKQRLTIFLVIYHDPQLLIFDEITSGLDFTSRESIIDLINKYQKDKTLLIVSHYFEEIEKLADKLLILDQGEILAYDKLTSLFDQYQIFSSFRIAKDSHFHTDIVRSVETNNKRIFTPRNMEEEKKLLQQLRQENISFEFKSNDIETLYMFVIEQHKKKV